MPSKNKILTLCYLLFLDPECKNYKRLDDNTRSVENKRQSYTCDKSSQIADNTWYRLVGGSGTQLPTTCVPKLRCGTHAPGWIQGGHPSVADNVVKRKVCFHWSGNCCRWNRQIEVRNCGNFYVYKLMKPPVCHLRYCGENRPRKYQTLEFVFLILHLVSLLMVLPDFVCDKEWLNQCFRLTVFAQLTVLQQHESPQNIPLAHAS